MLGLDPHPAVHPGVPTHELHEPAPHPVVLAALWPGKLAYGVGELTAPVCHPGIAPPCAPSLPPGYEPGGGPGPRHPLVGAGAPLGLGSGSLTEPARGGGFSLGGLASGFGHAIGSIAPDVAAGGLGMVA